MMSPGEWAIVEAACFALEGFMPPPDESAERIPMRAHSYVHAMRLLDAMVELALRDGVDDGAAG